MGMYTEFNIAVKLQNRDNIIDILRYMLGDIEDCPELPKHSLFQTDRWEFMLRSDSYYFDSYTDSSLFIDDLYEDRPMYFLNIRCNLKNYDDEINLFLDWLIPYIDTRGFIGYERYEGFEDPTLIYIEDHKTIRCKRVEQNIRKSTGE